MQARYLQFQLIISLLLTLAGNAPAEVIYVDATRGGWKNAHTSLHEALKSAKKGDEIWVADGTYKTNGTSFKMIEGVDIIGGFSGNERSLKSRDSKNNLTILDGEKCLYFAPKKS